MRGHLHNCLAAQAGSPLSDFDIHSKCPKRIRAEVLRAFFRCHIKINEYVRAKKFGSSRRGLCLLPNAHLLNHGSIGPLIEREHMVTRRGTIRRSRNTLKLNQLETRETPAGNISAALSGGVLTLTGDDAAMFVRCAWYRTESKSLAQPVRRSMVKRARRLAALSTRSRPS